MRGKMALGLAIGVVAATVLAFAPRTQGEEKGSKGPMIVHNVFFALKESNAASRKKLVDACKKYLTKHEGEVYFAAGPIAEEFNREVNDRDFDVCLTIVFKDKAAHDKYQDHKRHIDFIEENKATWKKVRVFDSHAE
ncbi:MAG: Dabb family protein [Gemmataceae bacterium]